MLVNSISAAKSAVNFNGKFRVDEFDKTHVFDTDDLPKAQYTQSALFNKGRYYVKESDEFVKIGTEKLPVYEAKEPCLSYEHGGDWTDLYITLPGNKSVCLGEDSSGYGYDRVHEILQRARAGETAPSGKPLSLNLRA